MNANRLAVPVLLSLLAVGTPAQQTVAETAKKPKAPTISLDFHAGGMDRFVAAVRDAAPAANIVLATDAQAVVVPQMELRGVSVDQALECACALAEGPVDVGVKEFRGDGETVYTILARRKARVTAGPDPEEPSQRVFTLNHLTMPRAGSAVQPLKVESILSAVELATAGEGQPPTIRYHQDSGVLLVRGTRTQVDQASEVIQVLSKDLDNREKRSVEEARPATRGDDAKDPR
jgi:hypothetical protein